VNFFFIFHFLYLFDRQNRDKGNNIFGTDPQETNTKGGTIAGQFKQTQMKSNIFGTDEPTTTRHVSDKNKSNIFGIGDSEHPSAPKHSHRGKFKSIINSIIYWYKNIY